MKPQLPDNYKEILKQLKEKIAKSQVKTVIAANRQMLWLYWQIGNEIIKQQKLQGWGAKVIDRLSADLKSEFPKVKGFSVRNLKYMQKFALYYTPDIIQIFTTLWEKIKKEGYVQELTALLQSNEIKDNIIVQEAAAQFTENDFLQSPVSNLTWTHHMAIMDKLKDYPQIFWYAVNTIEHGISSNILKIQIENKLYERQVQNKKITNFKNTLPTPQSDFANYLMKDPYLFDFVQVKEKADERNIEEQLVKHVTKFLLELGQGFAFVDNQYHINVDGDDFFIDLLFYHLKLHCYVVVELKARKFIPEDVGKLNFYVSAVDETVKSEKDNPTIGLLLCKGKKEIVAEYSLKGYKSPIGIAEYTLSEMIPEKIKSELPSIEEIEEKLQEINNK